MYCKNCGTLLADSAEFCTKCGHHSSKTNPSRQVGQGYVPPPPLPTARNSGMAIASMVLGILWLYWIGSILALIFGYIALSQIKQSPLIQGKGMAIAGVVLGWVGVGFLLLILVIAGANN